MTEPYATSDMAEPRELTQRYGVAPAGDYPAAQFGIREHVLTGRRYQRETLVGVVVERGDYQVRIAAVLSHKLGARVWFVLITKDAAVDGARAEYNDRAVNGAEDFREQFASLSLVDGQ